MINEKRRAIARHIDSCKILERELEHALADLHFLNEEHGTIHYAVDFSEIYAYLFPEKTFKEFLLFSDEFESELDAHTLQFLTLKWLFFGEPKKSLILLKPYVIEIEGLLNSIRTSIVSDIADLVQVTETLNQSEFKSLIALGEDVSRPLSYEEQELIVDFVERNAPALLRLIEPEDRSPLERLRELMTDGGLGDLDNLVEVDVNFDDEVAQRWYNGLLTVRRSADSVSSGLDALAAATLLRANQQLEPERQLHLVTRSKAMHFLLKQELEQDIWPSTVGYVFRHPRTLGLFHKVSAYPYAEAHELLKQRLESVQIFLKAAIEGSWKEELDDYLAPLISKIKDDFRSEDALRASMGEASLALLTKDVTKRTHPSQQLISLLKDRVELRDFISRRLQDLAVSIERSHEDLAFYIQSNIPEYQDLLATLLPPEESRRHTVLRATLQAPVPYTLKFYSSEVRQLVKTFSSTSNYTWEKVVNFLQESFDKGSDYEGILAMAFILAALDDWKLAEIYCERAIEIGEATEGILVDEGYFFLSICLRRNHATLERQLRALELLQEASKLAQQRLQDDQFKDPRYLKEIGTNILLCHVFYDTERLDKLPPPEEGLDYLKEAETLCGSDRKLLWQIYNNRLFFILKVKDLDDPNVRKDISELIHELEEVLSAEEPEILRWPPPALDTLIWAKWILHKGEPYIGSHSYSEIYKQILNAPHLERRERQLLKKHKEVILKSA